MAADPDKIKVGILLPLTGTFAIMLLILLIKPTGLYGSKLLKR